MINTLSGKEFILSGKYDCNHLPFTIVVVLHVPTVRCVLVIACGNSGWSVCTFTAYDVIMSHLISVSFNPRMLMNWHMMNPAIGQMPMTLNTMEGLMHQTSMQHPVPVQSNTNTYSTRYHRPIYNGTYQTTDVLFQCYSFGILSAILHLSCL